MPKRKRRIKKASIKFISLVPRGANRLPTIYKSDDGSFELRTLLKDDGMEERGELIAVVYAPEIRDSQGDIASAEVCKQMCHDFAKAGGQIDIRHNNSAVSKDDAFVAENFIVQKGDPRFEGMTDYDGKPADVTGAWATVIKIDSDELRKSYREDGWGGVSMAGSAEVVEEPEDLNKLAKAVADALAEKKTPTPEDEVKPEDIAEITKAVVASLKAEGLVGAPTPEVKKEESPPEDEAPVFKGDPTDKEALAKHLTALHSFNLRKTVDFSDPSAVEALLKSDETTTAQDREVALLKAKLAKLQKGSNQGAGAAVEAKTELEKCMSLGSAIAATVNKKVAV